jgi:Tol biopolymer transport system component
MKPTVLSNIRSIAFSAALMLPALLIGQQHGEIRSPKTNSRIAFIQATSNGSPQDIYTMRPDGTDERQLTNLGPNNAAFWENWSADGSQIVFSEYPNSGPGELWLMNGDGSNQHPLLSEGDFANNAPSFSPDGAFVVFTRCKVVNDGDGCAIYRIRVDGTDLTSVTHFQREVSDWEAVYSPDGSTIVFESFSRGGLLGALYLMDADGSNIRLRTPAYLGAVNPHWSPDGERIAFSSHCCNPQNPDVWTIRRDGSDLTRLTGNAITDRDIPIAYYYSGPSWSPDGKAIAFDAFTVSTNLDAVEVIRVDSHDPAACVRRMTPRSSSQRKLNSRQRPQALVQKLRRTMPRAMARVIEENAGWPRWSPEVH